MLFPIGVMGALSLSHLPSGQRCGAAWKSPAHRRSNVQKQATIHTHIHT